MKYTFHNMGTVTSFAPNKTTFGDNGARMSMLDFHKELVRQSGRKDVYIMDHKGRDVDCSTSLTPSLKAA